MTNLAERGKGERKEEGEKWREEEKMRERLLLLSKFLGDPTIDLRRSKRQSSSTRRGLQIKAEIEEFRQTPRGRGFSPTQFNPCLRAIQMAKVFRA